MPKISTVKNVLSKEDNDAVQCFVGTLVNLWEHKSGVSQKTNKAWSLQNGKIKDQAGDEIKVVFKDREELPQKYRNQSIVITSKTSPKGGWTGIKAKDDTYTDPPTRILYVTPSATIQCGDVEPEQPQGSEQPPPRQQQPTNKPANPAKPQSTPVDFSERDYRMAKIMIQKFANLHAMVRLAVMKSMEDTAKAYGIDYGSDHLHAATSTVFIDAVKAGLAHAMPIKPLSVTESARKGEGGTPPQSQPQSQPQPKEPDPEQYPSEEPEEPATTSDPDDDDVPF